MESLNTELRKAIANKDLVKLNQLKHQIKVNSFINRYVEPNGITGSVPPSAWIEELPKFLACK